LALALEERAAVAGVGEVEPVYAGDMGGEQREIGAGGEKLGFAGVSTLNF